MVGRAWTGALVGIGAVPVRIEVDVGRGLPSFQIVGLPDTAVQESRERIRSALTNSGLEFPMRRLTANLAPADVRKEGPVSDLGLALAILAATGRVPAEVAARTAAFGELSLTGEVRPVAGMLCLAGAFGGNGVSELLVAEASAPEAALATRMTVRPVSTLAEAVEHLAGERVAPSIAPPRVELDGCAAAEDFADVRGQAAARRALEIAAAGGHNVLMVGPPGAGKTMLARRLAGIMPPLSLAEALDVARVHSIAGPPLAGLATMGRRPFRAPHHTVSIAGLAGGGNPPRPGEVSLAHLGVLFLDEMAEFGKAALQVLRQPMEDGRVTVARAARAYTYPARFMLVGAMNPCPCGYRGDRLRECACSAAELARYAGRLSGPLIDRIDLFVSVGRLSSDELEDDRPAEGTGSIRARVVAARARATAREAATGATLNAALSSRALRTVCGLDAEARRFLALAVDKLALSGRGRDRVLRVSRTIADLRGDDEVTVGDVAEATQYRANGVGP